jgi:hypothetical protein
VEDSEGRVWWLRPELLSCEMVAEDSSQYRRLRSDPEFVVDWRMDRLVAQAQERLGPVGGTRCYCLKLPASIGGEYEASNLGRIEIAELVGVCGDIARQIRDLPEGTPVEIRIVD